ncbi:MAG: bifunctional tetrahydrofolate synthase/dihydrofolate synthase [Pirellulaceae bacterium]
MRRVHLEEWLQWIERVHPRSIDMSLERVKRVRRALCLDPGFVVITVGGTNGKGSTCAMLESMLIAGGYHVGCYTSPHLVRINERFRIGGHAMPDHWLIRAFEAVEDARGEVELTYFEYTTLAAMVLFQRADLHVAVLEVGLGGRLDAVNAFDPDCAIVTSVALDHMEYLGDTREEIGFEKAGIFRRNRPAIFGDGCMPQSVGKHAADSGARLFRYGVDFTVEESGDDGWLFVDQDTGCVLELPRPGLPGEHQVANAAASVAALRQLAPLLPVAPAALAAGIRRAQSHGRFQQMMDMPQVIVDVAHNPHSVATMLANLRNASCRGRTVGVFGMMRDKDVHGVLELTQDSFDEWWIPELNVTRALPADELVGLMETLRVKGRRHSSVTAEAAINLALQNARPEDRIVVFGSFVLAGEALQVFAGSLPQAYPYRASA